MKKETAIQSISVQYVNELIGKNNKIVGLEVRGKWLIASLRSGVNLWVPNED